MTPTPARIRVGLLAISLTAAGLTTATVGASESEAAVNYQAYIARAAKAAAVTKKKYGVPRAVTIAQSILESGWGLSGLSAKNRNYFGIKCGAAVSPYQKGCVSLASYEYVKGKKKKYVSKFRTYSSMEKSFLDYGRLLNYADRYNAAFKYTNDPNRFIKAVHKAGYATDPNYSQLVINTMKRWNLYRFDAKPKPKPKPKKQTPKRKAKTDPNRALIAALALPAQRSQAATGVPASVTIAQGLYHSGSGRATLTRKAKNYFGILCGGVTSRVSTGCVKVDGTKYRKYRSMSDSVADQGRVLSTGNRYRNAMRVTGNPQSFLRAIAKAGWSKKKSYVNGVYALVTRYGLTKYDLLISTTLKQNQRGTEVTALQHLLVRAGHKVKTTGYFGTDTAAAVKAFQRKRSLSATGKADPLTLTRITPDIRKGARGSQVAALHTLLRARHYTVDGRRKFGAKTEKAVKSLQKKFRLPQTGVVSVRTWGELFS